MTWAFGALAPFDTESTATDPEVARLVSATVARVVPGERTQIFEHPVAVEEEIPAAATEVHGITTEHAREHGQPVGSVVEAVAGLLEEQFSANTPVVGMNLSYDFTLLDRELGRCGMKSLEVVAPLIDVFVIDKAIDRFRPGKRTLTALCEFYGVRLDGAHDATFDALGAARIAYKMCKRAMLALDDPAAVKDLYSDRPRQASHIVRAFQALGRMSLEQLHAQQAVWYSEQAASFAGYLRQKANELEHQGKRSEDDAERETLLADAEETRRRADGVSSDWPLRPLGDAA